MAMEPCPDMVGDQLESALEGRYTIERELGRGGMATDYLARDPKHRRRRRHAQSRSAKPLTRRFPSGSCQNRRDWADFDETSSFGSRYPRSMPPTDTERVTLPGTSSR